MIVMRKHVFGASTRFDTNRTVQRQKIDRCINIGLRLRFVYISFYISLSDDCHVKTCKFTALSSGSFCQIYRVTDEALIAETAVWPNFFLMNVFFALKGSKHFIIILNRLLK